MSSAPTAVLGPCSCEHNVESYIICRLCGDVFAVHIKKHRKLRGAEKEAGGGLLQVAHCAAANLTEIIAVKALII